MKFYKYLPLFVIILLFLTANNVHAAECLWIGSGLWSDGTNWSTSPIPPQAGDNVMFDDTSVADCTADSVVNNLGSITLDVNYTGTVTFNPDFVGGGGMLTIVNDLTVNGGTLLCAGDITAINASSGGAVGNPHGTGITIQASNVTIGPFGTISADEQGFPSINGTGDGPGEGFDSSSACGGGYGGKGGYRQYRYQEGGITYGKVIQPTALGSAGGFDTGGLAGGTGGGAIRLQVLDTVTIDGTISVNGGDRFGSEAGGGSGGSIWIATDILTGSGFIKAQGGNGNSSYSGGGGGGRIALIWTTNTFTGTINAAGGTGYRNGFAGTLSIPNNVDLTVNEDIALAPGTYNIPNLTITNNATLECQGDDDWDGTPADEGSGVIINAATVIIDAGAKISADELGYLYDEGPGAGKAASTSSGGGYGGRGGDNYTHTATIYGGITYGSVTAPTSIGSGGGRDTNHTAKGGAGGGAIKLIVSGTITISGEISADGGGRFYREPGGGSGGSIWIIADTLDGIGIISADGGNGNTTYSGGGGGGRIALEWTTKTFDGIISAAGGAGRFDGFNGTLSFPDGEDLTVNGDIALAPGIYNIPTLIITNNATLQCQGDDDWDGTPEDVGSGVIINADTVTITGGEDIWLDGTVNGLYDEGETKVYDGGDIWSTSDGANGIQGNLYFNNQDGNGLYDTGEDIWLDDVTVNGLYDTDETRVYDGGDGWSTSDGNTGIQGNMYFYDTDGSTTYTFFGRISADELGYKSYRDQTPAYFADGPGAGINASSASGGGYGGAGGDYGGLAGGSLYGSAIEPAALGSAGGCDSNHTALGGFGGGAVKIITTGTFTINGIISANGGYRTSREPGGGSGGSIWVIADILTGTGSVFANGGNGNIGYSGGGGGGRIAFWYGSYDNTFTYITAYGGFGNDNGAAGTIVWTSIGGYTNDNIIPAAQCVQSTNGDGVITISFKIKDPGDKIGALYNTGDTQVYDGGDASWDTSEGTTGFNERLYFTDNNADGSYDAGEDIWLDDISVNRLYEFDTEVVDQGDGWDPMHGDIGYTGQLAYHNLDGDSAWDTGEDIWLDNGEFDEELQVYDHGDGWDPIDGDAGRNSRGGTQWALRFHNIDGDGTWDSDDDIWFDESGGTAGVYDDGIDTKVYDNGNGWNVNDGDPGSASGIYYHNTSGDNTYTVGDDIWIDNFITYSYYTWYTSEVKIYDQGDGWDPAQGDAGYNDGSIYYRNSDGDNTWDNNDDVWYDIAGDGIYDDGVDVVLLSYGNLIDGDPGCMSDILFHNTSADNVYTPGTDDVWINLRKVFNTGETLVYDGGDGYTVADGDLGSGSNIRFHNTSGDNVYSAGVDDIWFDDFSTNYLYSRETRIWDGGDGWTTADATSGARSNLYYTDTDASGGYDAGEDIWEDLGFNDNHTLFSFEYSVDGGITFNPPANGDVTGALSAGWTNNAGVKYTGALTFASAAEYSFTLNTKHVNVTGFDDVEQNDVQIRFKVRDKITQGSTWDLDSKEYVTSENFVVDNAPPQGLADLTVTGFDAVSVNLAWTPASDGFFDHYEIWYDTEPGITRDSGTEWEWDDDPADDPALGDQVTNTTTITGLSPQAYFLKIWAIDVAGNEISLDEIGHRTPIGGYTIDNVIPSGRCVQATDASGIVTVTFKIKDPDADLCTLNTFEYSVDGGFWNTPVNGDSSGCLSADWADNGGGGYLSAATFAAAPEYSFTFDTDHADVTGMAGVYNNNIRIRFMPNDGVVNGANQAESEVFVVDNEGPVGLADLRTISFNDTSMTLTWTTATDLNFNHYEIWYGTVLGDVQTRSGTASEWDETDYGNMVFESTNSTMMTDVLTPGAVYYFKIWAIDGLGNETETSETRQTPIGGYSEDYVIPAGQCVQATDGSGIITISFKVRTRDVSTCTLHTFEYSVNGGIGWNAPSNGDSSASLSAGWSDNGGSGYSSASAFAGSPEYSFTFDTDHADINGMAGIFKNDIEIRFTVNDGVVDSSSPAESKKFEVDNAIPVGLDDLQATYQTETSYSLDWISAGDNNFDHYEIWYGTVLSEVQLRMGTASQWDASNDGNLANASAGSTLIDNLTAGATYYFKIWAVDDFSNEATTAYTSAGSSSGIEYIWTNVALDNLWSNPNNWLHNGPPGSVPGAGDNVVFTAEYPDDCIADEVSDNLNSILLEPDYTGTVTFKQNFVSSGDTITLSGELLVLGGTVLGEGDNDGEPLEGSGITIQAVNVVVGEGGTISADEMGFEASEGPGAGDDQDYASGGAYGGRSGDAEYILGGIPYGSAIQPVSLGSGGGNDQDDASDGGAGGGAVKIVVSGSITIDGTISANGGDGGGFEAGGGSGGSIWIIADTITGTGTIMSGGGDGSGGYGGGGSGGRISLSWNTSTFTGLITAPGGTGWEDGRAGTLYIPDGEDLIVKGIIALAPGTYNITNLTVEDGGILEFQGNDDWDGTPLDEGSGVIINANRVTVEAGGWISADHLGFMAGQGPGAGQDHANAASGGGYGGQGGDGQAGLTVGGGTYGSVLTPTALGSGGGSNFVVWQGGAGGGAIKINAGTVTIDGIISANGEDYTTGHFEGGGSGGSIWIIAGEIEGTGSLSADGGYGNPSYSGGGGGGRIMVKFTDDSNFNSSSVTVSGGMGVNNGYPGSNVWTPEIAGIEGGVSIETVSGASDDTITVRFTMPVSVDDAENSDYYTIKESGTGDIVDFTNAVFEYDYSNRVVITLGDGDMPGTDEVAGTARLKTGEGYNVEVTDFTSAVLNDVPAEGDTGRPQVSGVVVRMDISPQTVEVIYNEAVDRSEGQEVLNYELNGSLNPASAVQDPESDGSYLTVRLTFSVSVTAGSDTVNISGVSDLAGNMMNTLSNRQITEFELTPPKILLLTILEYSGEENDKITIKFSEPVKEDGATDVSNYIITNIWTFMRVSLSSSAVEYNSTTNTVQITVSAGDMITSDNVPGYERLSAGSEYRVEIDNIYDLNNNKIADGTQIIVTAQFGDETKASKSRGGCAFSGPGSVLWLLLIVFAMASLVRRRQHHIVGLKH